MGMPCSLMQNLHMSCPFCTKLRCTRSVKGAKPNLGKMPAQPALQAGMARRKLGRKIARALHGRHEHLPVDDDTMRSA